MNFKTIRIREDVYNKISDYCKLNNLKITDFCSEKLENSILIEQYGDTPFGTMIETKQETKKLEEKPVKIEKPVQNVTNTNVEPVENNAPDEQPIIKRRRL
jgi:hypothetical protein